MARSSIRYVSGFCPGRAASGSRPSAPSGETSTVWTPSRCGSSGSQTRRRTWLASSCRSRGTGAEEAAWLAVGLAGAGSAPRATSQSAISCSIGLNGPRSSHTTGRSCRTTKATRRRSVLNFPLPSAGGLKWLYSRKSIRAVSRGRAACTWAGVVSFRARCGSPAPRQLALQVLLPLGQLGDLSPPGRLLLEVGRHGQGEGGQAACGVPQVVEHLDDFGLPGPLDGPAKDLDLPLAGEDGPLPGQHGPIRPLARTLRLPVQRQGGIEFPAEGLGHGQLLSLGLGGGRQFQVTPRDLKSFFRERLSLGQVPLRQSRNARLYRQMAVSGWRSPRTRLRIARACS